MLNRILDRLEEGVIISFMGLATLIIFFAVAHRYTSGIPWLWQYTRHLSTSWTQELCIYLFIWMAKFGAAYGVRTGIHVGVDVLVRNLTPARQKFFVILSLGSGAFFTAIIALLGGKFVHFIYVTGQISPDLEMPMWIIYLAIPLGSSLMCYRFLQVLRHYLKSGELPVHSYGEKEMEVVA
ncbi:MAG: C4-dicarboxylate ABC transporter permease [Gallionellales bacterium 35-53-114]|jgi:C4-dicarboxylate transporter DctQ subunit|nr:MAG: C4-dicarboxylate ABC transporter permease [Gallionellales bacterium 35-53-114]OYZ64665.1 MAG: C4-dicarboxylate ABC transporter permease [Gallionellales bacterium 24-53-125]OZB07796.1 MAG: C4-dicarboxylate ABC transporter permease [Gallionellales bacterium 39-52-133]HQS58490.1 TRAP transporter small permease [Gallionellaceae bacterium]HQS74831.1 TRAP transporter small permease [Gallionellaceae bacterium]